MFLLKLSFYGRHNVCNRLYFPFVLVADKFATKFVTHLQQGNSVF